MSDSPDSMLIHDGGYYLSRQVELDFDAALERAKRLIEGYGFGVQWETDVKSLLQEKLGKQIGRYTIVGACRPYEADRSLASAPWMGVLMPCNIVVREDEAGAVWVGVKHPGAIGAQVDEPEVYEVTAKLTESLREFLEEL